MNRVIAKSPNKAKVDDEAAYQPVWGAGGEPGGTLLPSSKMTITLNMRNSIRECSLPVCKVWAISPFLALRLGDLARAAGLRAGDFARAGDLARPRGFGAGEAARARRVATIGCKRRGDGVWRQLNLPESGVCACRRGAAAVELCHREI